MYNRTTKGAPLLIVRTVLSLITLLIFSTARADNWIYECVHCPKMIGSMSDHCIALDDDGNPHIAYGLDHLYYAWFNGSSWVYETIDNGSRVGNSASLAIDYLGRPHISYYDSNNEALKYAWKDARGWVIELIDGPGDFVGMWTCVALDKLGNPHIAYYAGSVGHLFYAFRDGANWVLTPVDTNENVGSYLSIGVDWENGVHISYCDWENQNLKYAYRDGTDWDIQTVDALGDVGRYTSLTLGSSGSPHISYNDDSNGALKYASMHKESWQIETIDALGISGWYTSVGLDSDGYPHISYQEYSSGDLKYAYKNPSGWQIQTVDAEGTVSGFTSVALDEAGRVHIAYREGAQYYTGTLKYAMLENTEWALASIDTSEYVGLWASLALDIENHPHIGYLGRHYETIRYARKTVGGWTFEIASDLGQRIGSSTIALSSNGVPHMSSQIGYPDGQLLYFIRDQSSWTTETIESDFDYSWSTSLVVDQAEFPHIVFHNPDGFGMKHAFEDELGWNTEIIDLENFSTHEFCSVLDNAGNLHVGYMGYTGSSDLVYAYQDGSGWHSEIADAYGEGGMSVSLALDRNGNPHLSHIANPDLPYPSVRYAYEDADGWYAETLEFVPAMFTSIDVDSRGRPHIAYFDMSEGDLRYAVKQATGWHVETIDAEGYTGRHPSLRIDSLDRVHISYHDHSNEDLRYVYQSGPAFIVLSWELIGNELQLAWTEVFGASYWVYGASNRAYFPPGFSPGYEHRIAVVPPGTLTWATTNGIGDPENNWAFMVLAVNDSEQELGRSNRVGEYDVNLPIPEGIAAFP